MEYVKKWRNKVEIWDYTEDEWNNLSLRKYVKYIDPTVIELKDMPDT